MQFMVHSSKSDEYHTLDSKLINALLIKMNNETVLKKQLKTY